MSKTGNSEMCGDKHAFTGSGKYCGDCGHLRDADCHYKYSISPNLIREIQDEYGYATYNFGKFNSAHEGYAVILEELEELKQEVFEKKENRSVVEMRREALQVATMAIRFIYDVCGA